MSRVSHTPNTLRKWLSSQLCCDNTSLACGRAAFPSSLYTKHLLCGHGAAQHLVAPAKLPRQQHRLSGQSSCVLQVLCCGLATPQATLPPLQLIAGCVWSLFGPHRVCVVVRAGYIITQTA